MSARCYFPAAVRGVEIPKKDGKKRLLGIPTISDRVAQMVVRMNLEPQKWSQYSAIIRMDTDPIALHWMQWGWPECGVGKCRGSLI